ncbi:unnamed protein product [marine sediment metagenome]|uniref:Uncharacterized protein n=1 Tax=marine sediment metagenome TaxID=412755 RepID=X0ZQT5_9ZZZZ
MIWNKKNSTYYDKGKRAYGFGDKIPTTVIDEMGQETREEYMGKGRIIGGKVAAETERDVLFAKAESLGLKPHYKAGIAKLQDMIEAHKALQALKKEALSLGIDPSDDVTFAELTILVDEKKVELEALNEPDLTE